MITGIVVALPEELGTLTRQKIKKGACHFVNEQTLVALSGAGAVNARMAGGALVKQGATQLISWGCAAALSDALRPGDLVLAKTVGSVVGLQNNVDEITVSAAWHAHCSAVLADVAVIHTGALLGSDQLISASTDKKRLASATGALALDMESLAIAQLAAQSCLPFMIVRAIADPLEMDLPKAISASLDAGGEVALAKLFRFLARHPRELPGLLRVGLQFNAARKTLTSVARLLPQLCAFEAAGRRPELSLI